MVRVNFEVLLKDWEPILRDPVLKTPNTKILMNKVHNDYKRKVIHPLKQDIFRAFKLTPFKDVRVVILGQGPYPSKLATGLAFGNDPESAGTKLSPPLQKIEECVEKTCYDGLNLNFDPTLVSWGKQGVLLLNSSLTVEEGKAESHNMYWRGFIGGVLTALSNQKTGVIFLLLGGIANSFHKCINTDSSYVFNYTHPNFAVHRNEDWNCPHFNNINKLIKEQNGEEYCIKW